MTPLSAESDARVRLAQLHLYVSNHLHDRLLAPPLTLITGLLLSTWVRWEICLLWVLVELGIIAAYIQTYRRFKQAAPGTDDERHWVRRIGFAHGLHMCAWSSIIVWGWQAGNMQSLMFTMLIHAGLISLTVSMSHPHRSLLLSDMVPPSIAMLAPPMISHGWFNVGLSLLGLFFIALMLRVALTMHASTAAGLRLRQQNEELIAELERQATHDSLTGLPNRRQILNRTTQALQQARGDGRGLAVMILDVDRFKPINDRWGHLAGDEVLIAVAAACRDAAQGTVGRLGGEEFLILLTPATQTEALAAAEALRQRVAALRLTLPNGSPLAPTASIGVTLLEPADQTLPELLHRADLAMYQAKAAGRNRVEYCDRARAALLDG